MKKFACACIALALIAGTTLHGVQQPPERDAVAMEGEREWLQRFVGEWSVEAEAIVAPGEAPFKQAGVEIVRGIGDFWIVAEYSGDSPTGTSTKAIMTLGYDEQKKKYMGTWIASVTSHLWIYEGSVDATGNILTLETQGPGLDSTKMSLYRDVTEFKSPDHRVLTSTVLGDDGKWQPFATINYRRSKPPAPPVRSDAK